MKVLLIMICLFVFSDHLFGQNLKVNQVERYFNEYRFAEANLIYKELILKDKIKFSENESIFRHSLISADKSRDFSFEYEVLGTLSKSDKYTFDDAFAYFQLSMFLGFYDKSREILNSSIVKNSTDPRKELLNDYKGGLVWKDFAKDTSVYKIKKVDFNSGKGDFNPIYHPKGIAFSSARDNSFRKSTIDNSSFLNIDLSNKIDGKVEELKFIESLRHDGTAYYDSLNLVWYYSKNLPYDKVNKLTTTGIFIYNEKTKTEIPFAFNSPKYFIAQPFLSEDGQTLWFSSDKTGGHGKSDIWYSKKSSTGWSEPINAGKIVNTTENEMFPFVQKKDLYFSSNGHPGLGGLDIFSVNYNEEKSTSLRNLGANLNSNADDFSIVLDQTGKTGYFASNRDGNVDQIYSVTIKKLSFVFKAKLIADLKGNDKIESVPVVVKENNVVVDTIYADKNGLFEFSGKKETAYSFEINNDRFEPLKEVYSTIGRTESDSVFKTLELISKYVSVNTLIVDEKTDKPLPNSKLDIKNPITGEIKTYHTDDKGMVKVELLRNKEYDLHTSHKGYFDNNASFSTQSNEKEIGKSIELKMIVKGTTIEVENILYDVGKAVLRPECKVELDKLVAFLKDNSTMKIELSAHTDSRGSDAKNLILSQQRAQSCVDYLISQGIDKNHLIAKGYGETKPMNRCVNGTTCSETEYQMNRRTEIKVLSVSE